MMSKCWDPFKKKKKQQFKLSQLSWRGKCWPPGGSNVSVLEHVLAWVTWTQEWWIPQFFVLRTCAAVCVSPMVTCVWKSICSGKLSVSLQAKSSWIILVERHSGVFFPTSIILCHKPSALPRMSQLFALIEDTPFCIWNYYCSLMPWENLLLSWTSICQIHRAYHIFMAKITNTWITSCTEIDLKGAKQSMIDCHLSLALDSDTFTCSWSTAAAHFDIKNTKMHELLNWLIFKVCLLPHACPTSFKLLCCSWHLTSTAAMLKS